MAKTLRKQQERLRLRRHSFDDLPKERQGSRTRPGSMNPRKSRTIKESKIRRFTNGA